MKEKWKTRESNRIITILVVLSALFISLIIYLSYFELFSASKVQDNAYNKRLWLEEEYVLRGSIYDRNGTPLATSTQTEKGQIRNYEYGSLYSHIIGYNHRELGRDGLEKTYNRELLAISESSSINEIRRIMAQNNLQQKGNDLILTLDHRLQQYAKDLLGNQKGSIVMMDPVSGEIYVMVSTPAYNPNKLKEKWENIVSHDDSPLLNRATQGLYSPGSIFKIITTASVLKHPGINTQYNCQGQVKVDGWILKDYGSTAHGHVDLHESFVRSCNVAFGQMALELGQRNLQETAEGFMLNASIPLDINVSRSSFSTQAMSKPDLAATGIGQGKTLVTPLNMAMVASAIANGGDLIQPILLKEIVDSSGEVLGKNEPSVLSRAIKPEVAEIIKGMMVDVVNRGTGKNAGLSWVQVAGKTGTAQVEGKKDHAWFVGFAPADQPKVAVAIVLEHAGSTGGKSAAPMASKLISKALENLE